MFLAVLEIKDSMDIANENCVRMIMMSIVTFAQDPSDLYAIKE